MERWDWLAIGLGMAGGVVLALAFGGALLTTLVGALATALIVACLAWVVTR